LSFLFFLSSLVVAVHKRNGVRKANADAKFSREHLQKYISFARTLNPSFTNESQKQLVECYRLLRQNDILGKNKTAYRITVRQLESLIRLSEALARLHLNKTVTEAYVKEAFRLLQKSIIFVESEAVQLEEDDEEEFAGGDRIDEEERMMMEESLEGGLAVDQNHPFLNEFAGLPQSVPQQQQQPTVQPTEAEASAAASAVGKKSKAKTQITAKEYDEMTNLLTLHLKQLEDDNPELFIGCKWKELADWYLETVSFRLCFCVFHFSHFVA
jgi:DNA replicative helicase MCM subunit Mcm2 (Cdc46/Mcm family)